MLPVFAQIPIHAYDSVQEKTREASEYQKDTLYIGVDTSPFSLTMLDAAYQYGQEHGIGIVEVDLRGHPYAPDTDMNPAPDLFFIRGYGNEEFPGYEKVLFDQSQFQLVASESLCREMKEKQWSALDGKTIFSLRLERIIRIFCIYVNSAGKRVSSQNIRNFRRSILLKGCKSGRTLPPVCSSLWHSMP